MKGDKNKHQKTQFYNQKRILRTFDACLMTAIIKKRTGVFVIPYLSGLKNTDDYLGSVQRTSKKLDSAVQQQK